MGKKLLLEHNLVVSPTRKTVNENLIELIRSLQVFINYNATTPADPYDSFLAERVIGPNDMIGFDFPAELLKFNKYIEYLKSLAYSYKTVAITDPTASEYYDHFITIINIFKDKQLWLIN